MAQTDLDVVNRAITKAGGEPIGALSANTPLAVLAATQYPAVRDLLLSRHRWVFAKRVERLTRLATAPADCPRTYAFARPNGLVGAIHDYRAGARDDAIKVSVLQVADYLASDADAVWVEFTAAAPEATWPPWFEALAVCAFAVDVANARGRRAKATELMIECYGNPEERGLGGLMGEALRNDSENAPKRTLEWENGGALVAARFDGGAYGLNDSRLAAAIYRSLGVG